MINVSRTTDYYMDQALEFASQALKEGEVPIGAVIVDQKGDIIGRGSNKMHQLSFQGAHAEMQAIKEAGAERKDWRLDGCVIYVTLEPCLMCFGLITLSRLSGIFFGASSPLFGCGLDNKDAFPVYKKDLIISGGHKKDECVMLLQQFFKEKRTINKG